MNKAFKVISLGFIGSIAAWLIWLVIYLANKTPVIEFDGPAGFGMILAAAAGFLVFGATGIVLMITKRF